MDKKEIRPKTLISVLAAAIREDADFIAQKIVEKAKNDNVEYASLVEQFILNKRDSGSITFSTFCENAFEQIKETKEINTFSVELKSVWRKNENSDQLDCEIKNSFSIQSYLKTDSKDYWKNSVSAYGNNVYLVFDEFKSNLEKKILSEKVTSTEVDLSEE